MEVSGLVGCLGRQEARNCYRAQAVTRPVIILPLPLLVPKGHCRGTLQVTTEIWVSRATREWKLERRLMWEQSEAPFLSVLLQSLAGLVASGHKTRTNQRFSSPRARESALWPTSFLFLLLKTISVAQDPSYKIWESRVLEARTLVKGRQQICFRFWEARNVKSYVIVTQIIHPMIPHSHSLFTDFYYQALDPATGACQGFCLSQPVTNSPDRL